MRPHRILLVTASMGAGHDQTAAELGRRFAEQGATVRIVDLLDILPFGIGHAIARGYALMLRRAPWLYDAIYQVFFVPHARLQPSTSPLVLLAAGRLQSIVDEFGPTAVVSTFHEAGQVVGRLRRDGRLTVPGIVVVTEVVPHMLWLAEGNDLFCCLYPAIADEVHRRTGAPAIAPGPVVDPRITPGGPPPTTDDTTEQQVLVSTGSWGVGDAVPIARALTRIPGIRPVVLCGRNEDLRAALSAVPGVTAHGWRRDVPELMAAAAVVVDNAGGSMCMEAFATGVPVVCYRPIPGHGGPVVRAMAEAGLVRYAPDEAALVDAVDALRRPGPDRDDQLRRAAAIFAEDPATAIARWLTAGA